MHTHTHARTHARNHIINSTVSKATLEAMVSATLGVYNFACKTFRPTPRKCHYVFNLRDFSRVVQGLRRFEPDEDGSSRDVIARLWSHEILRAFYDRLNDDSDQLCLLGEVREMLLRHFGVDFDKLLDHLDTDESGDVDVNELRSLFFGDYMSQGKSLFVKGASERCSRIECRISLADSCLERKNQN